MSGSSPGKNGRRTGQQLLSNVTWEGTSSLSILGKRSRAEGDKRREGAGIQSGPCRSGASLEMASVSSDRGVQDFIPRRGFSVSVLGALRLTNERAGRGLVRRPMAARLRRTNNRPRPAA
jgi:hypothetical protein